MKEIMQTYGSMIVAVIICIMLLSCFPAVKSRMSEAFVHEDVLSGTGENGSYDSYRSQKLPVIAMKDSFVETGMRLNVSDMFEVTSDAGNLSQLQIYAVYDADGQEHSAYIGQAGQEIEFPCAGIYTMYVKILCKNGMEDHAKVNIPVNQKTAGGKP
ncbi:hypothetical protein [Agathobacter sp.]